MNCKNHEVPRSVTLSLCFIKHHAMKADWGSGGIVPRILNLGGGGKWSGLRLGCFTIGERAPSAHWIVAGSVVSRAFLDAVAKRIKNLCSFRESNHGHPVLSLVTILNELPGLPKLFTYFIHLRPIYFDMLFAFGHLLFTFFPQCSQITFHLLYSDKVHCVAMLLYSVRENSSFFVNYSVLKHYSAEFRNYISRKRNA
jgi:hypothetical protein